MWSAFLLSSVLAQGATSQPAVAPSSAQPASAPPSITVRDGFVLITDASGTSRVNTRLWPQPRPTGFTLESGSRSVRWTERGAVIQTGRQTRATRFVDSPTSPRFFSADEIQQFQARLSEKELTREAAHLSGWEQIGSDLFLLVRWIDRAKKPWLEKLVRLDLSRPDSWFEAVAVHAGLSNAQGDVDDVLVNWAGRPAVVAELDGEWGLSTFPGNAIRSNFISIGRWPRQVEFPEPGLLRFVERTPYGTQLAGIFRTSSGRVNLAESRGTIVFPGDPSDIVQITDNRNVVLRNTSSGLELRLPLDVGVRNLSQGVVVWTPRRDPRSAVLYQKAALRAIARWSATPPSTAPARRPSGQSGSPPRPPRSR